MADKYAINYDDPQFQQVEAEKNAAIQENNQTYDDMISQSDGFYQQQIDAVNQNAETQAQNQQERTDFTIEQINQQKDQAEKDYTKEQSGAYVDWQKQSAQHGVNAEQAAAQGLKNTGWSESSQVSMYNTYQNRVATARESYQRAVLNYDNAIKDAQLQNNSILAEIAANALEKSLQLGLEGFQYKNQLITTKLDKKQQLEDTYYKRRQDIISQINIENERKFQADENQKDRNLTKSENEKNRNLTKSENAKDRTFQAQQKELDRKYDAKQKELDRKHDIAMQNAKTKAEKEMLKKQHDYDMAKLKQQHKNDLEILKKQNQYSNSSSSSSSSKSSGSSINKSSGSSSKKTSNKGLTTSDARNEKIQTKKTSSNKSSSSGSSYDYLNKLIASGASKDKVSNEISLALREGAITNAQAKKLRDTFTPRGVAY